MSPTQKRLPQTGSLFSCPAGGQAIKEIQGNHLKVNFQAEVGLDIRCPAGGQAIKEMQGKSLESKLSDDFPSISLSLLSDSNQRPRDYKSRALAN